MNNKLLKLIIDIRKEIRKLNQELTDVIGRKSVYGEITINEFKLIEDGCVEFYFSKRLTKEEEKRIIKILEKYFGELDRPEIIKHFKTEKGKYGYRWNTYEFFSYLKIKDKKPIWDVKKKAFKKMEE